jgi:hypothetical protein
MTAALGAPVRLILVVDQVVGVVVADEDHIPTSSTVSAVRATPRFILFPAKGHTPATTVTGFKFNYALIDEHSRYDAEAATFAKGWIYKLSG